MKFAASILSRKIAVSLAALLFTSPLLYAQQHQQQGGGRPEPAPRSEPAARPEPARAPVQHSQPAVVDRSNHGSVRHVDTHVVEHPVQRPAEGPHNFNLHHDVYVHHDVEVDFHRGGHWHDFHYGTRFGILPIGCISILVGGSPYYYDDGLYYQPVADGYQEVYPPVGADVPELPDGAVAIEAGNITYYYAGGAFYVQTDNGYNIAPPPIGVTVPELPPGAVQVAVNGGIAYQFNGIYYQPVFVDGVTQYMTFMP